MAEPGSNFGGWTYGVRKNSSDTKYCAYTDQSSALRSTECGYVVTCFAGSFFQPWIWRPRALLLLLLLDGLISPGRARLGYPHLRCTGHLTPYLTASTLGVVLLWGSVLRKHTTYHIRRIATSANTTSTYSVVTTGQRNMESTLLFGEKEIPLHIRIYDMQLTSSIKDNASCVPFSDDLDSCAPTWTRV